MTAPPQRRTRLISLRRPAGRPPGKVRRRIGFAVRLLAALTLVGGLYTAFAPGMRAVADDSDLSANAVEGKRLFETSCISCHGSNAQGVQDRGPSLIGVGSAAVEFQVNTGRMPLARQEAQSVRRPPQLTPEQARLIGQYIQEIGGGPEVPPGDDLHSDADVARGGELFRINCSSCHAFAAGGGALSSGKSAPGMEHSTDRDIYAAMLSGPSNMPVFGDNQLTPEEKRDIIAYVQNMKSDRDPGGWGLGRYGPVPEGLAIFLLGMVAIVLTTLWIAGKS
jgi:ubiquinol-cytochrome c reductase cytochrome c subunit